MCTYLHRTTHSDHCLFAMQCHYFFLLFYKNSLTKWSILLDVDTYLFERLIFLLTRASNYNHMNFGRVWCDNWTDLYLNLYQKRQWNNFGALIYHYPLYQGLISVTIRGERAIGQINHASVDFNTICENTIRLPAIHRWIQHMYAPTYGCRANLSTCFFCERNLCAMKNW